MARAPKTTTPTLDETVSNLARRIEELERQVMIATRLAAVEEKLDRVLEALAEMEEDALDVHLVAEARREQGDRPYISLEEARRRLFPTAPAAAVATGDQRPRVPRARSAR